MSKPYQGKRQDRPHQIWVSTQELEWLTSMRELEACSRKKDYATEEQAMRSAIRTMTKAGENVPKLYVYKCGHCANWHLTGMPPQYQPDKWK